MDHIENDRGNDSTEPLPSNNRGIFTEPSYCLAMIGGFLLRVFKIYTQEDYEKSLFMTTRVLFQSQVVSLSLETKFLLQTKQEEKIS
jgi:hypothetical protein